MLDLVNLSGSWHLLLLFLKETGRKYDVIIPCSKLSFTWWSPEARYDEFFLRGGICNSAKQVNQRSPINDMYSENWM